MKGYPLRPLPERLAIAQLPANTPELPELPASTPLGAIIRSPEEITLVCPEANVPSGARVEPGWRALKILATLDFSLVGVLAGIANVLAHAGISIFVLSTFDTDYILVKENALPSAIEALKQAGYLIME